MRIRNPVRNGSTTATSKAFRQRTAVRGDRKRRRTARQQPDDFHAQQRDIRVEQIAQDQHIALSAQYRRNQSARPALLRTVERHAVHRPRQQYLQHGRRRGKERQPEPSPGQGLHQCPRGAAADGLASQEPIQVRRRDRGLNIAEGAMLAHFLRGGHHAGHRCAIERRREADPFHSRRREFRDAE
jgi:hypothetical protein